MTEITLIEKPYKGLMPYTEEDALFFFGREAEQEIITANLMAARLTLLYGASGVGKTSVLRAGVAYHLRQLTRQNLDECATPEFAVVVFSTWRDDPIAGLAVQVQNSVAEALNVPDLEPVPPSPSLTETLQAWTKRLGGDLLIILDQFEEYFLYHPQEDGEGTFAVEFPRAVNRPDLRVNFLISIREDALAKLDRFKGRVPNLFANYLRIEHLDLEGARAAIKKPVDKYNDLQGAGEQPIELERALVNTVLEQVRTGQVVLGQAGRGVVGGETAAQIETPYLQLVMTRLWDEERHTGSRILRLETLERLGGVEHIVRTHLDTEMNKLPPSERKVAAQVFYYLVTPSGAKIALNVSDLSEFTKLSPSELTPVMEKLAGGNVRILGKVTASPLQPNESRYEILHDVLARAVLDWQARYVPEQKQAAREYELLPLVQEWAKVHGKKDPYEDFKLLMPLYHAWAKLHRVKNPYDMGPKNWKRCLYDLGHPDGIKYELVYESNGRLKYQ